jgi:hypothetical protein
MYRPNFCAACGARIERAHWRWWTSRCFCPKCAPRFRRGRISRTLFALLLLCGLSFSAGRMTRRASPPLVVSSAQLTQTVTPTAPAHLAPTGARANSQPTSAYGLDGTTNERPTDPNEIVSICGARTKKGTPCQRRVRGTGRCWQHLGMPAMLPPEKLIIQGKL